MTVCEPLYSYADLPLITPWITQATCRELITAGLFTPRIIRQETDADSRHMNFYDLIAVTAVMQTLRSGITSDRLLRAIYNPSCFRCDGFPEGDLLFLSTGAIHGQELSRFLEVANADVTILVRVPLIGEAEIEFIPNDLLGPGDYSGVTLTGVECRAIRDVIKNNIESSTIQGRSQSA